MSKTVLKPILGFLLLFAVYHFPEFFDSFWIMAIFKIGFLAVAYLVARWQGWKGLGGYGLGLRRGWYVKLAGGMVAGLVAFSIAVFVSMELGYENFRSFAPFRIVAVRLPALFVLTFFPSIAEDILTRGYLYGHLSKKMPRWGWVVFSAGLYVLNHIWRLGEGLAVLSYLFAFGVLLAYAVWRSGSLWLALGIHWGANIAFEASRTFVVSDTVVAEAGNRVLALTWLTAVVLYVGVDRLQELRKRIEGQ
ncbi:MAG: CPBP family intramembrane metalloprotease [Bacteroidetes bacterium]|nr:CPBP family intramembrane metalloprotease [Bacteroidota bacterium]